MGFADSVKASVKKQSEELNKKILDISTDGFSYLIVKTPVNKGVLSNNWWLGIGPNNYNKSFNGALFNFGDSSRAQVARLAELKEFLGKDGEVSFTNSTPYAIRAELIGWPSPVWSGRVGAYGMVRNTLTYMKGKNP